MKTQFDNKVIWILGASSGIGYSLSSQFSDLGAHIIVTARNQEKLQNLAAEHKQITPLPADLSITDKIPELVSTALALHGHIDIAIFSAGISQRTLAEDTPLENTRKIMETNFFSAAAIAKELLPHLKNNGGGRFVIISSMMGRFGARQRSSYAASKHALHGYFESLRAEEWKNNIRVTIAIIGYVNTGFSQQALNADGSSYGKIDQGQQKGMPPADCARKIISGIINNKEEILIGGAEKYATFLKRFAPTLLSKILRNRNIN